MIDILGRTITKDIISAVKKATAHLNRGTQGASNELNEALEELRR